MHCTAILGIPYTIVGTFALTVLTKRAENASQSTRLNRSSSSFAVTRTTTTTTTSSKIPDSITWQALACDTIRSVVDPSHTAHHNKSEDHVGSAVEGQMSPLT